MCDSVRETRCIYSQPIFRSLFPRRWRSEKKGIPLLIYEMKRKNINVIFVSITLQIKSDYIFLGGSYGDGTKRIQSFERESLSFFSQVPPRWDLPQVNGNRHVSYLRGGNLQGGQRKGSYFSSSSTMRSISSLER